MATNVLIVDDSELTRTAVKRIIDMVDSFEVGQVFEAANGRAALDLLEHEQVDLVLADLNMPEMNGIEMVEHMQQANELASIPVVVVSTESSTTRIKELLTKGIKNYLHKPFTPEEFKEAIEETLGASK